MKKEYDFSKGVRGKYAARYADLELNEATKYFLLRFSGEDVTISRSGKVIRVSGGFSGPVFEVTRHDEPGLRGWMVVRTAALPGKPEVVEKAARSYEQAAIIMERLLLANPK